MKKSVISLISYDAHYLTRSIKTYYEYVDEIILGLDKDRISWSQNKFSFDEEKLWKELQLIDGDKKISIIEDNFHRCSVPIENDNHERNFLKHHCENDWIFSFDADEELINAKEFFNDFCPLVENYDVDLMFTWFLPYKQIENGILMITNENGSYFKDDIQGFTTKKNNTFIYCRWSNNQQRLKSPLAILHWSFCRNQEELALKVNNFGHSRESKIDPFYETQKLVTKDNYMQLKNFKTSNMGQQWPALQLISFSDFEKRNLEESKNVY